MTTLNFALTRAFGRELREGDEIVITRLDHDGNVAPWLAPRGRPRPGRPLRRHPRRLHARLGRLERVLSDRTRVVAFPVASNAVGTLVDVARIGGARARGRRAGVGGRRPLRAARADRRGRLGPGRPALQPYKFCGPHMGMLYGTRELLERWEAYKVRPSPEHPAGTRYETGTMQHELLAGVVAALDYFGPLGWDAIQGYERRSASGSSPGSPSTAALRAADDGRPRADVHVHRAGHEARPGARGASPSASSPCGRATTTRSR